MPSLNLTDPSLGYAGYDIPGFPIAKQTSSMPSDLLYASMGLSVIGSIATAYGAAASAKAQGDYEQSIARTNATLARYQADEVRKTGDFMASRKILETQSEVGAIRAVQGGSGIDINSGSSTIVRKAVENVGATDALTIRNNADKQAWGYETEAISDSYKGAFARMRGRNQAEQSLLNGGLSAISMPLGIYARFKSYSGSDASSRLPFNLSTN